MIHAVKPDKDGTRSLDVYNLKKSNTFPQSQMQEKKLNVNSAYFTALNMKLVKIYNTV